MDKDTIEGLETIPNLELLVLFYDIKHVVENKEIIMLNAIKEINKKRGFIR